MQLITFSAMLNQIMNASHINLRKAHKLLQENGVSISYSSLAAYKAFTAVPSYERAQEVLRAFDYELSDEELMEVLLYSRSELKEYREDARQYLNKGFRMNPKYFAENMTSDDLELLIDRRIDETGEGTLNSYVSRLVKEDLIRSGLLESEDKE